MMIKRLLFVQRIGLKLLILSLLVYPVILSSKDKGEGLELPEVFIYGTYLGKMQFSPKKDFYPYISQGNLFPLSRVFSPEIRFPVHEKIPERVETITSHWLFLDAGAGNWWADKVFLDCGLRNEMGLLSFRFTDFRRKGWVEDHSVNKDFFKIKGVLNKENYYISGNIFYNYDRIVKGKDSPCDTFKTHYGGVGFLSQFDFKPVILSLGGNFSVNHFLNRCFGPPVVFPETIQENSYLYTANYYNPLRYCDIMATIVVEGVDKKEVLSGVESSKTITSSDLLLKKNFNGMFTLAPGIRMFVDEGKFEIAPLISLKTSFPDFEIYPYVTFYRRDRINTMSSIYKRYSLVSNIHDFTVRNYTVLKEKNVTVGFEGRWQRVSYRASYSHIEYDNYPLMYTTTWGAIETIEASKDVVKTVIGLLNMNYFSLDLKGSYTPRERIPYEPVAEVGLETKYKRFFPITLLGSLNTLFGIETADKTLDVALLNSGVEWEFLRNTALRFEVENIFDRRYEIWEGYTEGGVQFYASIKYKVMK